MSSPKPMNIKCPCCQAELTIDPETGDVLLHREAKQAPTTDIVQAAHNLKKEAELREETFQKSFDAEKRKGDTLKKKFDAALKRAKEDPDKKPPLRDIDLD